MPHNGRDKCVLSTLWDLNEKYTLNTFGKSLYTSELVSRIKSYLSSSQHSSLQDLSMPILYFEQELKKTNFGSIR